MADDFEIQENELLALQSIFEGSECLRLDHHQTSDQEASDEVSSSSTGTEACDGTVTSGDFSAHVQVPATFVIIDKNREASLKFLPPIILGFKLPRDYPSQSPPEYHMSCKWLTPDQMTRLSAQLDALWCDNEHSEILYIWMDFLQQDTFSFLCLTDRFNLYSTDVVSTRAELVDQRVTQDVASADLLFNYLLEYDRQQIQKEFEQSLYNCEVCFGEKLGLQSFKFHECGHVFCQECMKEFFSVRIKDGDVNSLKCPVIECETVAHPLQVKQLVSDELYETYDRIMLSTTLDSMKDVGYCPRPGCHCPVLLESDQSMGNCPSCHYVFCAKCKLTYHGVAPCKNKSALKAIMADIGEEFDIKEGEDGQAEAARYLVAYGFSDQLRRMREKLLNCSADKKKEIDEKYGRAFIQELVKEADSQAWISDNCKECPECSFGIQKLDGCNKMTCTKCKCYFCWLCMATLSRSNPYSHFSRSRNAGCALFPGQEALDDNDIDFV